MQNLPTRNNNPGDLKDPATGTFRTFQDPVTGFKALQDDLLGKMTGSTSTGLTPQSSIQDFAHVWAPASDSNDPISYANKLSAQLGVPVNTPIGSLQGRVSDFAKAVANNEGFTGTAYADETSSELPQSDPHKMGPKTFANLIREKTGAYKDVPDDKLTAAVLAKYPVYADKVTLPAPLEPGQAGYLEPVNQMGFLHSMYSSIASPLLTMLARPGQAAEYAAGDESALEGGNLFGAEVAPYDPNKSTFSNLESDVGRAAETVSLGLGPVTGGAAFFGGNALERNQPILPTADHPLDNALIQTGIGAAAGKATDIGVKYLGKGLSLFGEGLQTASAAKALLASAEKNWNTILAPTTKGFKTATNTVAPELAERGEIFTGRGNFLREATKRADVAGEVIDTIWNSVPEGTKVDAAPVGKYLMYTMKNLQIADAVGAPFVPQENQALYKSLDAKVQELLRMTDANGQIDVKDLRAWRQAGDAYIQKTKPHQFGASDADQATVAATKAATKGARAAINNDDSGVKGVADANRAYHLWDTAKDIMDATLLRKTGQATSGLRETINTAAGVAWGSNGVVHAFQGAMLMKYATKLVQSTLFQSTSAAIKSKLARAIMNNDTSTLVRALLEIARGGGKVAKVVGDFLQGLPSAVKDLPRKNIPMTDEEDLTKLFRGGKNGGDDSFSNHGSGDAGGPGGSDNDGSSVAGVRGGGGSDGPATADTGDSGGASGDVRPVASGGTPRARGGIARSKIEGENVTVGGNTYKKGADGLLTHIEDVNGELIPLKMPALPSQQEVWGKLNVQDGEAHWKGMTFQVDRGVMVAVKDTNGQWRKLKTSDAGATSFKGDDGIDEPLLLDYNNLYDRNQSRQSNGGGRNIEGMGNQREGSFGLALNDLSNGHENGPRGQGGARTGDERIAPSEWPRMAGETIIPDTEIALARSQGALTEHLGKLMAPEKAKLISDWIENLPEAVMPHFSGLMVSPTGGGAIMSTDKQWILRLGVENGAFPTLEETLPHEIKQHITYKYNPAHRELSNNVVRNFVESNIEKAEKLFTRPEYAPIEMEVLYDHYKNQSMDNARRAIGMNFREAGTPLSLEVRRKLSDIQQQLRLSTRNDFKNFTNITEKFFARALDVVRNDVGEAAATRLEDAWASSDFVGWVDEYMAHIIGYGGNRTKELAKLFPKGSPSHDLLTGKTPSALVEPGMTMHKAPGLRQNISQTDLFGLGKGDAEKLKKATGMTADDIMAKHPDLNLKRDVTVTDVKGTKHTIKEGEALAPYELKGNKILLKDGGTYVVTKNQYQNIKNNSEVERAGTAFAPEIQKHGLTDVLYGEEPSGAIPSRAHHASYQVEIPNSHAYHERVVVGSVPEGVEPFRNTGHFPDSSILGWYRGKMVNSEKYGNVYFGEEHQSDWNRKAREHGIRDAGLETNVGARLTRVKNEMEALGAQKQEMALWWNDVYNNRILPQYREALQNGDPNFDKAQFLRDNPDIAAKEAELQTITARLADLNSERTVLDDMKYAQGSKVPGHPLLDKWLPLNVKRQLMEAVERKSDWFAWTNGQQQIDRYNLEKTVDNVDWEVSRTHPGKKYVILNGAQAYHTVTIDPQGIITDTDRTFRPYQGKPLASLIENKPLVEKILAATENGAQKMADSLKVGGKWAIRQYDQHIKSLVEDFTGEKVQYIDLGAKPKTRGTGSQIAQHADGRTMTVANTKVGDQVYGLTHERFVDSISGDHAFTLRTKYRQLSKDLEVVTNPLQEGDSYQYIYLRNSDGDNVGSTHVYSPQGGGEVAPKIKRAVTALKRSYTRDRNSSKWTVFLQPEEGAGITQPAIKLTPRVKALILGEAPPMKKPQGLPLNAAGKPDPSGLK